MKIEARLRVDGEVTWIHDPGAELPEGFCIRGERPAEIDVFFNGRKIGYLVEYPRFNGDRFEELGNPDVKHTVIFDTELVCMLDLEALVAA